MSRFIIPLLLTLMLGSCTGSVSVVKNKTSNYEILIANNADSVVIHAAEEFQFYLNKISGVKIPLVTINKEIFCERLEMSFPSHGLANPI